MGLNKHTVKRSQNGCYLSLRSHLYCSLFFFFWPVVCQSSCLQSVFVWNFPYFGLVFNMYALSDWNIASLNPMFPSSLFPTSQEKMLLYQLLVHNIPSNHHFWCLFCVLHEAIMTLENIFLNPTQSVNFMCFFLHVFLRTELSSLSVYEF